MATRSTPKKTKPSHSKARAKTATPPARKKPAKKAIKKQPSPPPAVPVQAPPLPASITAILDTCPLGVAISNVAEAKIIYANVPMARFFGLTRVAAHGQHVSMFYSDPTDREYVRATLAAKGHLYRYRMRGKAADGSERRARLSSHVIAYNGEPHILSWIEEEADGAIGEPAPRQGE